MVNLYDIMRNAQNGEGISNLSQQFGLSSADTQRAVEALLPAFTLGFQRAIHNPSAFGQFVDMLSSGRYAPFFDQAKPSPAAAAWAQGNDVLIKLLGSKEVTRQVAEQAASMTGIGVQVLQQMLPMLAAMIMGGVFRYASLQGMSDLFAQWSEAFRKAHEAQQATRRPPPTQPAPGNPFEAWMGIMGSMFGSGRSGQGRSEAPPRRPAPESRNAPNPTEAWSSMVDAMLGKPARNEPPPAPPPPAQPPPPPPENPLRTLAQMFDTGREVQAQHLANLQTILDEFWGSARAR